MIQQTKEKLKQHSGKLNIAAYTALIIYGANLLIGHGEQTSDLGYCEATVESEFARANKFENKYEACITSSSP
jgi:hypothetical protein